jgi:large subunit ribosomal protein L4
MATAVSYSKTGSKHEATVRLDKAIFGLEPSHELIAQAYRTYLANGRSAQASTLKRGQVSGGGKKPWRQKGTGRARVGSIRVPHWRGGGSVFGPTGSENHTLTLPLRVKRLALRHALSARAAGGDIVLLEAFNSSEGKVKPALALLSKLKLEGNLLLVVKDKTDLMDRATRNVAGLKMVKAAYLTVFDIMNADKLIFTNDALETVKSWLGDKA